MYIPKFLIFSKEFLGYKESIIILLLAWGLGFTPFISSLDHLFYDYYNSFTPASSAVQSNVLLIEADYDAYVLPEAKIQMEEAAKKLLENDAAQLVFLFDPQLSSDFYLLPQVAGKVFIGRQAMPDGNKKQLVRLLSKPISTAYKIPIGIVSLPYTQSGIYREQFTAVKLKENILPSIEMLAAQGRGISVSSQTYWVNFVGGTARLPRLTISQAVQGNIVPELVKGRSIVIGLMGNYGEAGIHYPGSNGHPPASANEFHAFALNTILNKSAIEPYSSMGRLGLIVLISLITMVIFQITPIYLSPVITLIMIALCATLTWFQLVFWQKWAPLPELILLQITLAAILIRSKNYKESEYLERMMLDTLVRLREIALPENFKDSNEHWTHLVTMVRQMLPLNRMIFLERIENKHYLKEVVAFNCDINDINEMRRDYERTPYTSAVKHNGPLAVEGYLTSADKEECTLMIPLSFAGEILGFWVMGISPAATESNEFKDKLNLLTDQISILLYQRKLYQFKIRTDKSSWMSNLVSRQTVIFEELQRSTQLFTQKNEVLSQAFHDMATAAIVYDLFGRVLQVNHHMNRLLRRSNINPNTLTASDLVSLLTKKDISTVQSYIQHCVFDHLHLSFPLSLKTPDTKYYMLNLRALKSEESINDGLMPFQVKGLLIELVDMSAVNQHQMAKKELINELKYAYRNDLAVFMMSYSILSDETSSTEQRTQVLNILHEKMINAGKSFNKTVDFLSLNFFDDSVECYPVEMLHLINDVLEKNKARVNIRNISITSNLPQLNLFAMASSKGANQVFEAIVPYMLETALDNSIVEISLKSTVEDITFYFSNTGIGMLNERLQDFLYGPSKPTNKPLIHLRRVIHLVELWGGNIKATTAVGYGISIALTLKRFNSDI